MEGKIPISVAIFFLGYLTFVSAFDEHSGSHSKSLDVESDVDLDKRLYDFGKKPYHYMAEYKRLPLYNFGLGKRSPRYNFGLGKRFLEEEDMTNEYDEYPYGEEEELTEPELYLDDDAQVPEKRQRLYSFGLGKRLPKYDFGLGKRGGPYDFGLGKRTQRFNFGLGKRNGMYSFGLGKKAADPSGSLGNRFSFGLGKRSEDFDADTDLSRSYISKREISSKNVDDSSARNDTNLHGMERQGESGVSKDKAFAHDLDKRSRNSVFSGNGFSRPFRKPFSYNFGLGKRRPLYDFGLGKRNFQDEYGNVF